MQLILSKEHGLNPGMQVCFFCGDAKGVLLFGANKGKEAPRETITDYEPCDCCKGKFAEGFLLIEASKKPKHENQMSIKASMGENAYPTGSYWLLKEDAAQRIFGEMAKLGGKAFVDKEVATLLGLYDEEDTKH
jgi:hypothetical protein